jgi:hypothetical protein
MLGEKFTKPGGRMKPQERLGLAAVTLLDVYGEIEEGLVTGPLTDAAAEAIIQAVTGVRAAIVILDANDRKQQPPYSDRGVDTSAEG